MASKETKRTQSPKQKEAFKKALAARAIKLAEKKKNKEVVKKEIRKEAKAIQSPFKSIDLEIEEESLPKKGIGMNFFSDSVASNSHTEEDLLSKESGQGLSGTLDELDIFQYAYKKLEPYGDIPNYRIYKNNEYIGKMYYPCSWDEIKKIHGGGFYKVQACKSTDNTILKTQTMMIARSPEEAPSFQPAKPLPEKPVESASQLMEQSLLTIKNIEERFEHRAKAEAQAQANSSSNMMGMLLTNMQTQSQQQMQMMMEMMKFQTEALNRSTENTNKQLERLGEVVKEVAKEKTNKNEMGPLEMLKFWQEAAAQGENRFKAVLDTAKEMAEEMAAQRANDDDDESEKESLSDTLIRTLANIMSVQAQKAAVNPAALNQAPQAPTPEQIAQAKFEAQRHREAEEYRKAQALRRKELATRPRPEQVQPKITPEEFAAKVQELVLPQILKDMSSNVSPAQSCKNARQILVNNKISLKKVVENLKIDDIIKVASDFGMSIDQISWIKEFYANLETAEKSPTRCEHTASVPNPQVI